MTKWPEHGYVERDEHSEYYWKARTLWAVAESLPIEQISLDSFDWQSDNFRCNSLSDPPLWRDIGEHIKRALAADLQYPIIISADGNVMDGMHRILKCYAFGMASVMAVRFDTNPTPDIVRAIDSGHNAYPPDTDDRTG
ncbi:MAG: chromosome partitioning protein ParB [Chloroflexota bacterium]|nr:MAG: chromosome partitioning protein ParB [Chloroflexota bacterium]